MPAGRLLVVAAGGVAGATIRWVLIELGGDSGFPWPTFIANVLGSALLAWVTAQRLSPTTAVALGTGFCGGLTTFSTFSLEIVERADEGDATLSVVYAVVSIIAALIAFIGVRRLAEVVE